MPVDKLRRRLDKSDRQLSMAIGQKDLLLKQINDGQEQMARHNAKLALYEKTQSLLLEASASAREQVKGSIETLVTYALRAIKGEEYGFKIQTKNVGGQYSMDFLLISPDGRTLDIMSSVGGGIADIVSVAMRIAILQLYDSGTGPILLDEDFKFLSRDNIRAVVEFLQMVISKTGRQIIMITHIPEFSAYADNVIEVISKGDYSEVTTTKGNI